LGDYSVPQNPIEGFKGGDGKGKGRREEEDGMNLTKFENKLLEKEVNF